MRKPKDYWNNKKRVLAKAKEFQSLTAWSRGSNGSLAAAKKYGWYWEASAHMTRRALPRNWWTKERVLASAKQYISVSAWKRSADKSAYQKALDQDWLKEACAHMTPLIRKKWSEEELFALAKQYSEIHAFIRDHKGAYAALRHKGLMKEATQHMPRKIKPRGYWN